MFAASLARVDAAVLGLLGDSAILYTPGDVAVAPKIIRAVFDALYVNATSNKSGVSTSGPAVFTRLGELPTDPRVDLAARVTVTANGMATVYKLREVQPDGQGAVVLLLTKAVN